MRRTRTVIKCESKCKERARRAFVNVERAFVNVEVEHGQTLATL